MPDKWQQHPSWGQAPGLELWNDDVEVDRLVVVSAHPDDESLGVGGLISLAHRQGITVYVVLLTAGEASHPPREDMSRHSLATQRLGEMDAAVTRLAPGAPVVFLGAPDNGVEAVEDEVVTALAEIVGDGTRTLLVAPWRLDGHPDHDAAGRAAARVAEQTGARLVEYPLLGWRLRDLDDMPWDQFAVVDLDDDTLATKLAAIRAHESQLASLTDDPDSLSGRLLGYFTVPVEHLVVGAADRAGVTGQPAVAGA